MVGIASPETNYISEKKNINGNETKADNSILINFTAEFNDSTILNVEEEFNQKYINLEGKEIDYFGIVIYFYERAISGKYEINFRSNGKIERIDEMRARILELIKHLGGEVVS